MYLLPQPQQMQQTEEMFTISYSTKIIIAKTEDTKFYHYAQLLQKEIKTFTGITVSITRGSKKENSIYIESDSHLEEQEYQISITQANVTITGGNHAGIFYGIQTLRQIIGQSGCCLCGIEITDYPEIPHRGYYYDVTRGRIPTLTYLKELADTLAHYKINQLQLYIEHSFLFEQFSEMWRDDTPITSEEILELDTYCLERNIELVPSIASFGHLWKLLSTKTYAHLCELEDSDKADFSYIARMQHHTIDVTNPESISFIQSMLEQYIPLFTSNHFNICADETFDLGTGKSQEKANEVGKETLYINFINQLCEFLIEKGKRPMIWGDIICGFPEKINQLPKEIIYLNWGYAANQKEDETKILYDAGAAQYNCPGVGSWNQFIPCMHSSYCNILRMCSYAVKYHSIGILNTDWGDFGHINHPKFSIFGIIYGAAFSWNKKEISFEEINKQISLLEFLDPTESIGSIIAMTEQGTIFSWENAVRFMEYHTVKNYTQKEDFKIKELNFNRLKEANQLLGQTKNLLSSITKNLDTIKRKRIVEYQIAIDGMILFNNIAAVIAKKKFHKEIPYPIHAEETASQLEQWFYYYKQLWRSVSKESELFHIQDVINWYADYLRD